MRKHKMKPQRTVTWTFNERNRLIPLFNAVSSDDRPLDAFRGLITVYSACAAVEAYSNSVLSFASGSIPLQSSSFWTNIKVKMLKEKINVDSRIRDKLKFILKELFQDGSWNDLTYQDFYKIVELRNALTHWIPQGRKLHALEEGKYREEADAVVLYLLKRQIISPPKLRPVLISNVVELKEVREWVSCTVRSILLKISEKLPRDSNELRDAYMQTNVRDSDDPTPTSMEVLMSINPNDVDVVPIAK